MRKARALLPRCMLAARLARSTAAALRTALPRACNALRAMAADAGAFAPDALETEVGISVFANNSKGFTAVLKHRCAPRYARAFALGRLRFGDTRLGLHVLRALSGVLAAAGGATSS